MAKSIRSKRKRKLRAIKRVRYGAKELERLKKTLGIVDNAVKSDVAMGEENVIVFDANTIQKKKRRKNAKEKMNDALAAAGDDEPEVDADMKDDDMEIALDKTVKSRQFPNWMHQRKIARVTTIRKRLKKIKKKKMKKTR